MTEKLDKEYSISKLATKIIFLIPNSLRYKEELSLLASLPQGFSNCGETITSLPVSHCEKKTGRSLSAPLATFPSKRRRCVTLRSELWVTLTTAINVLSVFCSLETVLHSWTNPLEQLSGKTHSWWSGRGFGGTVDQSSIQRGDFYFKRSSRSQGTLLSSSPLTSQWNLMLTTQHNSIGPCLSIALPVTSIVNQGRGPLV